MTRLFNDAATFRADLLDGLARAYGRHLHRVPDASGVARHALHDGRVAVVTGGGSGHYPAFAGLVGDGMAAGAVVGEVFTSPSAEQVHRVARAVDRGAGVLLSFGNYAGDVINFGLAADRLHADGISSRTVLVTDDTASAPLAERRRRRGIAGDFTVFKTAGAAADRGDSLAEVARLAQHANDRTVSLGVAFSGCTLPGEREPLFRVADGDMALGLGIHGEPGVHTGPLVTAAELVPLLLDPLLAERPADADGRVAVLLNSLGATGTEELLVLAAGLFPALERAGLEPVLPEVGALVTSLDMAGCSLTLTWLDDELANLWAAPADTPGFRRAPGDTPRAADRTRTTGWAGTAGTADTAGSGDAISTAGTAGTAAPGTPQAGDAARAAEGADAGESAPRPGEPARALARHLGAAAPGPAAPAPAAPAPAAPAPAAPAPAETATGPATAGAGAVCAALAAMRDAVAPQAGRLGRLDAVAGDGDHGSGMTRGLRAASAAADRAASAGGTPATVLHAAAAAWADRAGGTSGVLWGGMLDAVANVLPDDGSSRPTPPAAPSIGTPAPVDTVTKATTARTAETAGAAATAGAADAVAGPAREEGVAPVLVRAVRAATEALVRLGQCAPGDKTMLDALLPFRDTLATRVAAGDAPSDAWRAATTAADRAARDSAALRPRLGRARPLAERSVGTQDPGAVSLVLCLRAVGGHLPPDPGAGGDRGRPPDAAPAARQEPADGSEAARGGQATPAAGPVPETPAFPTGPTGDASPTGPAGDANPTVPAGPDGDAVPPEEGRG